MSAEPMRTRTAPARIPGFSQPARQITAAPAASAAQELRSPGALDFRAGTRQLNVRVLAPLLGRYKRLVRDLEDEGFQTSLTELTHALLHSGPQTPEQARRAVKDWRRALDPPD